MSEISKLLLQKMSSQINLQQLKVQSQKYDQIVGTPQIGVLDTKKETQTDENNGVRLVVPKTWRKLDTIYSGLIFCCVDDKLSSVLYIFRRSREMNQFQSLFFVHEKSQQSCK